MIEKNRAIAEQGRRSIWKRTIVFESGDGLECVFVGRSRHWPLPMRMMAITDADKTNMPGLWRANRRLPLCHRR